MLSFNDITFSAVPMTLNFGVASTGGANDSRTSLVVAAEATGLSLSVKSVRLENDDHTAAAAPNAAANGSLGGFKLSDIKLGASSFLITPRANASGIVITSAQPQTFSTNFGYYDTDANAAGTDGYLNLPIKINDLVLGSLAVDVSNVLQLALGATTIGSIELGNNGVGNDQIMIGTGSLGRIGISSLRLDPVTLHVTAY